MFVMCVYSLDEEVVKELFDVDAHVKKVVHDAFEQCDTSQVIYMCKSLLHTASPFIIVGNH